MTGIILSLIGGLGLFLYGLKLMSSSLEEVVGVKMRSVMENFAKTPFHGILAGAFFTAIIQSSSATTVMVVSFVNSGLLNLYQAAGVIMGANVGTTITSQIIAFDLSDAAPIIVMLGVIMLIFVKKTKAQHIGEVLAGFGILFMGFSTMAGSMSVLKESTQIVEVLSSFDSGFAALLAGLVVTALFHSSSAAIGIVILLAQQGFFEISICYYIILGCHLGACTPTLLASVNGKKEAIRAALSQLFFNIIGVVIVCLILTAAQEPITAFFAVISNNNAGRMVANAHTLIRVAETALLLPFMRWIVNFTGFFVSSEEDEEEKGFELQFIGETSVFSPTTAVFDATRELEFMGKLAIDNLEKAMNAFITLEFDDIKEVYQNESYIDYLNDSITDYLVEINQISLPDDDKKILGSLFHVVNDIERIGDHAENIADAALRRLEQNIDFSVHAKKELSELLELVIQISKYAMDMFSHNHQEHVQVILDLENKVDEMEHRLHDAHVERLTKHECTASAGMMFSDIISGLERVSDHATNIAFALLEEDPMDQQKDFRDYL